MNKKNNNLHIFKFMSEVFIWLVISLICWFILARIINIPLVWISTFVLNFLTDGTIDHVEMLIGNEKESGLRFINQVIVIVTNIPHINIPESVRSTLEYDTVYTATRPLLYGYGLPAFVALTLALPKDIKTESRKWFEIFVAYWVFQLTQLLGITTEGLSRFIFNSPEEIGERFPFFYEHPDILGVLYQMATLLVPSVTPIILWVIFNTFYLERLIGKKIRKY